MKLPKHYTAQQIREYLSDAEIYDYYMGESIKIGKAYTVPFRKDSNSSLIFGRFPDGNISWKDMASGDYGNVFEFVKKLTYQSTLQDTYKRIYNDLVKGTRKKVRRNKKENVILPPTNTYSNIEIRTDSWDSFDLSYWSKYNISLDTLEYFNVKKIKFFKIIKEDKVTTFWSFEEDPIYGYIMGDRKYKLYRPFTANRKFKWFGNSNALQGYDLLPDTGDVLIVTKSLKDVMCLYEMGLNAIAPSSETAKLHPKAMVNTLQRFKHVYLLFDNDYDKDENWGQIAASKRLEEYPSLSNVVIPDKFKSKDISDMIELHGFKSAKDFIYDSIYPHSV